MYPCTCELHNVGGKSHHRVPSSPEEEQAAIHAAIRESLSPGRSGGGRSGNVNLFGAAARHGQQDTAGSPMSPKVTQSSAALGAPIQYAGMLQKKSGGAFFGIYSVALQITYLCTCLNRYLHVPLADALFRY